MTRKNNTYRLKGRAIFLAAIMIISVLAMPIAFAGGAAAAAEEGSLTFENQAIGDGVATVEDVSPGDGGSAFTDEAFVVITTPEDDDRTIVGAQDLDGIDDGDDVDVSLSGASPGEHEAHIIAASELVAIIDADNDIDEVADFLGVDAQPLIDSDDINPYGTESAELFGTDRYFPSTSELTNSLVWQGQEVTVDGFNAGDEVQLRERLDEDTTRLRDELSVNNDNTITFETDARSEGDYFIRGPNSDMENGDIDTFEIAEQDLTAEFDDDEVATDGANALTEIEFDSIRGNYAINVSANGDLDVDELSDIFSEGDLQVSSVDDDEDRITLAATRDGDYELNFTGIDEGDYEFDFEVVDSTASASDSISVVDSGDGELSVEDANVRQGDIAEIVVSADNTDEGTIVIGDEDDVNYQINATIDFGDVDEVTLNFNTYIAGQLEDGLVDGDDILFLDEDDLDDDAELSNIEESGSIDGILDTGDYEITVSADMDYFETFDNPDDVGSLFIEERSLDDINTWTAASNVVEDLLDEDEDDQADFALEGIENDLITPSDSIAHDDFVVHQLEASGLEGLLANSSDGDASAQLEAALGNEAIDLRVRETRDSVGPNAVRDRVDFDETDVTVLHDDDNEQYFLIINTDDIVLQNSEEALEKDEDYKFDVRFQLQDERLLDVDEDDLDEADGLSDFFEDVTTDHEVVERDGSFDLSDDDQIEVEAGDEQLITGDTNIAPGSEVQIRIRGTGDARFSKSQSEIVVDADGNFTGEFDFSDSNVDDEFTATLRNVVTEDDNPEEDGIVVDSVDEVDDDDMDDADDEPVDTDDDMDDEPVDTDDDDTVEETEDDTPGFGALVALLAVLGAALLAVRRQN